MAKFFYRDCVITDAFRPTGGGNVYTATIDGREIKKLIMEREVYDYLMGAGKGATNRVWFMSFFKFLTVISIQTQSGERHYHKNTASHKFYDLIVRPPCFGFLAWLAAWAVLIIPVALLYQGNGREITELMEPLTIYIGVAGGIYCFYKVLLMHAKVANPDSWTEGDINPFTKALKPKFGSALAGRKE